MGARLIEEVLTEWREGERLLRQIPPLNADHETVRFVVIDLRAAYTTLSATIDASDDTLEECRRTIERARAALAGVRAKVDPRTAG